MCGAYEHPQGDGKAKPPIKKKKKQKGAHRRRMPQILCEIIEISQIIIARNSILNKGKSDKCIKTVINIYKEPYHWSSAVSWIITEK